MHPDIQALCDQVVEAFIKDKLADPVMFEAALQSVLETHCRRVIEERIVVLAPPLVEPAIETAMQRWLSDVLLNGDPPEFAQIQIERAMMGASQHLATMTLSKMVAAHRLAESGMTVTQIASTIGVGEKGARMLVARAASRLSALKLELAHFNGEEPLPPPA